jgi:hypothetical protein
MRKPLPVKYFRSDRHSPNSWKSTGHRVPRSGWESALYRRVWNVSDAASFLNVLGPRWRLPVLSRELRSQLTPVVMALAALEQDSDLRPDLREHLAMT